MVSFIICCSTIDIIYNQYIQLLARMKPWLWDLNKYSANVHVSQMLSIVGDIPSVGSTTSDGSGSQLQAYETMSLGE